MQWKPASFFKRGCVHLEQARKSPLPLPTPQPCFHALLSSSQRHLDLCYPGGQETCLSASFSPLLPSRNAFVCFSYKPSLVNNKIWANSTWFIYIGQIYFLKMKLWWKEGFKLAFLKQVINQLRELSMIRDTKQRNNCCLVISIQSLLQLHTNTETTYSPLREGIKEAFCTSGLTTSILQGIQACCADTKN